MNIQAQFFAHINNHFNKETFSLVDDLSHLLHIERSTAYKRISGKTPLKMDEIKIICNHYNVSLDSFIFTDDNSTISSFEHKAIYKKGEQFIQFLSDIAKTFDSLRMGKENTLLVLCNDLPILYFLGFPKLMYFVYLFCKNESEHFLIYDRPIDIPPFEKDEHKMMIYISQEYSNHPSTEIFSDSILDYIINRIKFSSQTGLISEASKTILCEELISLCDHLEKQCVMGQKINGMNNKPNSAAQFLFNPLSFYGQNEIYYCTDGYEKVYVSNNIADYFSISDKNYCQYVKNKILRVKDVSVNITIENKMQRNQFFKNLKSKINTCF